MTRALREFFIQEATEYLDKFAATLAVEGEPNYDRLRRLARALRGSARMADQELVARAAAAMQSVASELGSGERNWDMDLARTVKAAVAELRELIASIHAPPHDFGARLDALIQRLGGGLPPPPPSTDMTLADERFRSYLATELRRVCTEIADATEVLERDRRDREPLKRLLRRIRPLRGVQALSQVPAADPALAALEEVILRIADTGATVGPGHLALFRRAQQALVEVAENLARGAVPRELGARRAEIEDLKEQILEAGGHEVVWISELFYDEPGPHVESCPMADRGAGSWHAFFVLETTGSLDTADRLRAEMVRDSEGARPLVERLAYTFRQLRERAVTFGHGDLGQMARRIAAALAAQAARSPVGLQGLALELEETLGALRDYVGAEDDAGRAAALERAEASLAAALSPGAEEQVPIESLTYAPDDALVRALELQDEAIPLLDGGAADRARARALLEEIFGLIELALGKRESGR